MSKLITEKFSCILPDEPIIKPLVPTSIEEGGDSNSEISEIKINGIYAPIVKVNNIVLLWQDILYMKLYGNKFLPELALSFKDRNRLFMTIDTPGPDHYVIIEILPSFEVEDGDHKCYKKIKLKFFIKNISINELDRSVSINGIYYCDKLNDDIIESFGKISTYKFFEQVAQRLKLGLCSNLDGTEDERYIYLSNQSLLDGMIREKDCGGNPQCVIDAWVDWWNNINVANIYDLYKGQTNDDLSIWVDSKMMDVAGDAVVKPTKIKAVITNNPRFYHMQFGVKSLRMINKNSKNYYTGTDKACNTYDVYRTINDSKLIEDGGSVKKNIFVKYYYLGEFNGEENDGSYLMNYSDTLIQKMNNNMIEVTIDQPCFGLMRGGKVDLEWYDGNAANPVYNSDIDTNINITPDIMAELPDNHPDAMRLNKKISGQYYIYSSDIEYLSNAHTQSFQQHLILTREFETFNYIDCMKNQQKS